MPLRWCRLMSISKMYFNNISSRVAALALVLTLVTACGGGGSEPSPAPNLPAISGLPSPPAVMNRLDVIVDKGPEASGRNVNRLYADVTICEPGSVTRCQTIDHLLIDTGSTGMRLLSSAMTAELNLSRVTGASGLPLLNCVQFIDFTSAWGPVARADIWLGGMKASSVPMQVIGDPAFNSLATASPPPCSGTAINTVQDLGAKGIIGLGLFKEDCGTHCVVNPSNGTYFTCTDANCSATVGTAASLDRQLKNPVSLFATDNNGVLIDLPSANLAGAPELKGAVIFGIGTQDNNLLGGATVLTTNSVGHVTTLFDARSLGLSFLDTGSNGLFFDSAAITPCGAQAPGFYCPPAPQMLEATLTGANGASSPVVSFTIDNALALFADSANTALPTLGGDIGDAQVFDWGLPFFYGRRVFIGIEGQAPGPFYAF